MSQEYQNDLLNHQYGFHAQAIPLKELDGTHNLFSLNKKPSSRKYFSKAPFSQAA